MGQINHRIDITNVNFSLFREERVLVPLARHAKPAFNLLGNERRQIMEKKDALLYFFARSGTSRGTRRARTVLRQTLRARRYLSLDNAHCVAPFACSTISNETGTTGTRNGQLQIFHARENVQQPRNSNLPPNILYMYPRLKKIPRIVKLLVPPTFLNNGAPLFKYTRANFYYLLATAFPSLLLVELTEGRKRLLLLPLTAAFSLSKLARVSGTGPKCITILSPVVSRRAIKMPV